MRRERSAPRDDSLRSTPEDEEKFLIARGVNASSIFCVDIARESIEKLKEIEVSGFVGTLNEVRIEKDFFDVIRVA